MKQLINKLKKTEHGFKHIQQAGENLLADRTLDPFDVAGKLLSDASYQARMLATHILGELWKGSSKKALRLLKTKVAKDENWRVQEMLAKAFDGYCDAKGYENSIPVIKEWLNDPNPNLKRAVIEGLRIWTNRPYFKDNAPVAIRLISGHKADDSEYLRKSVGNALCDIGKKHTALVQKEISGWNLSDPRIAFTHKLAVKNN